MFMSSGERMIDLLGNISDTILVETMSYKKNNKTKKIFWTIGLVATLIIIFLIFIPIGQTMAAQIKEGVKKIIEDVFPCKEVTLYIEGIEESNTNIVYSDIKEEYIDLNNISKNENHFIIYYDQEEYEAIDEEDIYIIQPKTYIVSRDDIIANNAVLLEELTEEETEKTVNELYEKAIDFYNSLPKCNIKIVHNQDISLEQDAQSMRQELLSSSVYVSDIEPCSMPEGLYMHCNYGDAWNDTVCDIYFVPDDNGGVYVITAQYYNEVTEGHGARFNRMIESFEIINI